MVITIPRFGQLARVVANTRSFSKDFAQSLVVNFTQVSSCFNRFRRQAHKMIKHTQKNRWQIADEFFEFDHFVGLAPKELKNVRGFGKLVSLILQNRNDFFFFNPFQDNVLFILPENRKTTVFF